jgi:hypothetical protein
VSHGPSVVVQVSRSETLVRAVEKGEMALFEKDGSRAGPLFAGEVDTRRVVGACVEEEDGLGRGGFECFGEAFKVESDGLGVVVGVVVDGDSEGVEDGPVVR